VLVLIFNFLVRLMEVDIEIDSEILKHLECANEDDKRPPEVAVEKKEKEIENKTMKKKKKNKDKRSEKIIEDNSADCIKVNKSLTDKSTDIKEAKNKQKDKEVERFNIDEEKKKDETEIRGKRKKKKDKGEKCEKGEKGEKEVKEEIIQEKAKDDQKKKKKTDKDNKENKENKDKPAKEKISKAKGNEKKESIGDPRTLVLEYMIMVNIY
jgi:hypothetical protein